MRAGESKFGSLCYGREMVQLIGKQLVKFVVLMFAVSIAVFCLVGLSPIDPVQANVGQAAYAALSPEKKAELVAYWGADLPIWKRYLSWLVAALGGDLGISLRFNQPVLDVIAQRAGNTLALMSVAWLLSGALGFVMGIVSGMKRDGIFDKFVKGYCFVLASTPAFWFGLLMLMVFSVWLGWFPMGFSVPIGKSAADVNLADMLYHLVLPAATLSVVGVANVALHTREKTIDVMESDYIRFAQARGMTRWQALRTHGLRNLVLPAITLQCASISEILGGSVLVEQVFSYPGLGQAAVTAGIGGDAALLVGIALVSAVIVFSGNLLANILYRVVDPRIRQGGEAL